MTRDEFLHTPLVDVAVLIANVRYVVSPGFNEDYLAFPTPTPTLRRNLRRTAETVGMTIPEDV